MVKTWLYATLIVLSFCLGLQAEEIKPATIDPIFKAKFGIETTVAYVQDYVIPEGKENEFLTCWKGCKEKDNSHLTANQLKQIDAYFASLKPVNEADAYEKKVEIRFVNDQVGLGIFAKEKIPAGTLLGHYAGELTTSRLRNESLYVFLIESDASFYIDAQEMGNWTRYMNHAEGERENLFSVKYYGKSKPYILFFVGEKPIPKGKQLLFSYGPRYWTQTDDEFLELTKVCLPKSGHDTR